MRSFVILAVLAVAAPGVDRARLAADMAYAVVTVAAAPAPAPSPSPSPTPAADACPECNGTGKLGDGTVFVTCPDCNGTGKKTAAEPIEPPLVPIEPPLVPIKTPPAVSRAATSRPPVVRRSSTRWTVAGSSHKTVSIEKLARHLQETHGIDPTGYTREELLTLHDNDHNGHNAPNASNAPRTTSSRVIRSQSTCPGGTCPTR